jgi:hypothetical protein
LDASGARSHGASTNQRKCRMTLSIGKGDPNITKGGPATLESKEVMRWNATRHGIRSPIPVVPGVDKKEDWEEHRAGVLESLSPFGQLELVLAERVAAKLLPLAPWQGCQPPTRESRLLTDRGPRRPRGEVHPRLLSLRDKMLPVRPTPPTPAQTRGRAMRRFSYLARLRWRLPAQCTSRPQKASVLWALEEGRRS